MKVKNKIILIILFIITVLICVIDMVYYSKTDYLYAMSSISKITIVVFLASIIINVKEE